MSPRHTWRAVALSACCACNGVGRALVDYEPPTPSEMTFCSAMRCEGVLPVLAVPDTAVEYGDLSRCNDPTTVSTAVLPLAGCGFQSFELELSAAGALPVVLGGPGTFAHCRLRLRSERPLEVQLVAARLEDVHI